MDDVLLVAAELLANVADHAGGTLALELRLDPRGERLRIDVTDASRAEPRIFPARAGQPHHRGLRILDHIASAWGCRPHATGKAVWAEIRLP